MKIVWSCDESLVRWVVVTFSCSKDRFTTATVQTSRTWPTRLTASTKDRPIAGSTASIILTILVRCVYFLRRNFFVPLHSVTGRMWHDNLKKKQFSHPYPNNVRIFRCFRTMLVLKCSAINSVNLFTFTTTTKFWLWLLFKLLLTLGLLFVRDSIICLIWCLTFFYVMYEMYQLIMIIIVRFL